jgi:hypothetical protein
MTLPEEEEMSLKQTAVVLRQTAVEILEFVIPTDVERFRAEHPVLAAAHTPLLVVAGVAVGGVVAGMSLLDILICGLVAGAGVALFCAAAAWLFSAPLSPGLSGLRDGSGQLRPLRFQRHGHPGRPAPAHPANRSRSAPKRPRRAVAEERPIPTSSIEPAEPRISRRST